MMTEVAEKKVAGKFGVMFGCHSEGHNEHGKPRIYETGDVVESMMDLEKWDRKKFRRVRGDELPELPEREEMPTAAPSRRDKPLDRQTVEELRSYAAEWDIDLGQAKTKAEVLAAIKEAENG